MAPLVQAKPLDDDSVAPPVESAHRLVLCLAPLPAISITYFTPIFLIPETLFSLVPDSRLTMVLYRVCLTHMIQYHQSTHHGNQIE